MTFCAWLLSSSIFLIFIHTLSCISTTLIFIYELASHCMYILQFVYPLIHWWIFVGFFLPLAFVSSAAMNIGTYVFVWVIVFNSLRCISSRILGYMVILCLTFWGNISLPNSFFFFAHIFNISGVFFIPSWKYRLLCVPSSLESEEFLYHFKGPSPTLIHHFCLSENALCPAYFDG